MITVWLPIKNYENYEVSICGMVRNITSKRILKPKINGCTIFFVDLYENKSKAKKHYIHQLVAKHFLPNINNDKCIDHKNNNPLDNTISNLRWVSQQQNIFNSSLSKKNTSGIKGVVWTKKINKWRAIIQFNKKI